jgi:hypothetical protein
MTSSNRRRPIVCMVFSVSVMLASLAVMPIQFTLLMRSSSAFDLLMQPSSSSFEASQPDFIVKQQSALGCLTHTPIRINVNGTKKPGSDPTKNILEQRHATTCGTLKRQWLRNPPISDYARLFHQHQSNCSLPVSRHYLDNTFGLGAHFILWGQALCNAREDGYRMDDRLIDSSDIWLWLDQGHCQQHLSVSTTSSPMECYLPVTRNKCSTIVQQQHRQQDDRRNDVIEFEHDIVNVTDPRNDKKRCALTVDPATKAVVHAAFTEYLFSQVSPLVIQEAQRQIGVIFQDVGAQVPDDLVTVHIRWGDKVRRTIDDEASNLNCSVNSLLDKILH